MEKTKILLIEDDEDIREGIRILLNNENYAVAEAPNGEKGLAMLDETVDLVILDVMMPGISGIETCRRIRENSVVPILFLTAKTREADKLIGLAAGGDDYLPKPFSYAELMGRVKALLRRYQIYSGKADTGSKKKQDRKLEIGNICISQDDNQVWVNGEEVNLTDLEYRILKLLMENPGKNFSAQKLYESVWNESYMYASNSTVMVHIRKLRMKVEEVPEEPKHIKTIWGKGYRFE